MKLNPPKPYWFLETYYSRNPQSMQPDPAAGMGWWIQHDDGKAYASASDKTAADAALHVCTIANRSGGVVQ